MKINRLAIFACTTSLALTTAHAEEKAWTWRIDFEEQKESISDEQLAILANDALMGNMRLKRQFARAFVGCGALKFTWRCEAMRKYSHLGERFLKEIVNLQPDTNDERERYDVGYFQELYFRTIYVPRTTDPESPACKEWLSLATRAYDNGNSCFASQTLQTMSYFGHCMEKNDPRFARYLRTNALCVID